FLLMDLGKRGLAAHANAVLNAYLEAEGGTGNLLGLTALPLFLAMRATIRAKVEMLRARMAAGSQAEAARDEARAYFSLAQEFLAPTAPRLVAVGGLSGTGKSAVSRAIAPRLGAFPGAVIVRSDVERKRLFGVAPEERLPARAYAPEVSDQVYAMSLRSARRWPGSRPNSVSPSADCGSTPQPSSCGRGWRRAGAMSPTRHPPWSTSSLATTSARKVSR